MLILIQSLITGVILGAVFTLLKLPLPAPNVLPGIVGIIGIYLGFLIISHFIK